MKTWTFPISMVFSILLSFFQILNGQDVVIKIQNNESAVLMVNDTNCVSYGPEGYYIPIQVCNSTGTDMTNFSVTASLANDPASPATIPAFALGNGQPATQNLGTLPANSCKDVYYYVSYSCTPGVKGQFLFNVAYNSGTILNSLTLLEQNGTNEILLSTIGGLPDETSINVANTIIRNDIILNGTICFKADYSIDSLEIGDTLSFQPAGNDGFRADVLQLASIQVSGFSNDSLQCAFGFGTGPIPYPVDARMSYTISNLACFGSADYLSGVVSVNSCFIIKSVGSMVTQPFTTYGGEYNLDEETTGPVGLAVYKQSLTAKANGLSNVLEWTPDASQGSMAHIAEKSINGSKDWQVLESFDLSGGNRTTSTLKAEDASPAKKTYYRIAMKDANGRITYSNMAVVKRIADGQSLFSTIYPNPAQNELNVGVSILSNNAQVSIDLVDMQGKVVQNTSMLLERGQNNISLDINHLNTGMYIAKVKVDNQVEYTKFVVR